MRQNGENANISVCCSGHCFRTQQNYSRTLENFTNRLLELSVEKPEVFTEYTLPYYLRITPRGLSSSLFSACTYTRADDFQGIRENPELK